LEETAGILKYRSNVLHDGFANALHALTLEQDSEEIRLLLNVFKNEFALYRILAKDRRDLIFVVFLFLLQVSLMVAGMIYAS